MQRPNTSSLRSDCLQRSSPKAVKLFNNPEFLFLVIAALHQLTSDMSSHLLMAKVLTTSSSHHADQPPWFVNRLNLCALWLMGYAIKTSFPRPPQWRHGSPCTVHCRCLAGSIICNSLWVIWICCKWFVICLEWFEFVWVVWICCEHLIRCDSCETRDPLECLVLNKLTSV